jgi:hypothetical protein
MLSWVVCSGEPWDAKPQMYPHANHSAHHRVGLQLCEPHQGDR